MNINRILFSVISILIMIRVFVTKGHEEAIGISVALVLLGTLIWFTDFWTDYILAFGFWESKATDFKTPGDSSAALVFLAWVVMLVVGWAML